MCPEEIDCLIKTLKNTEPFELVNINVNDQESKVYIRIYTKSGVIQIAYKAIGRCPICSHEVKVTEISCKKCKTVIKGEFELCKFCKLNDEQRYFIEVFLKNRGNIKEMEK